MFKIQTWFDLVTPESASRGDFESTGCDLTDLEFDSLHDAVEAYVDAVRELGYVRVGDSKFAQNVAYAEDPVIDYTDASEEYYRVAADVPDEHKSAFNAAVSALLAA